ncbi:hypothetical protein Bca4012_038223 [Brassica carinata]|uniref:Myb-like domain-containing protein n=1 Tax=Brassica carinata TaxID=52824 RepID=A0A8X7W4T8_BRACI|nr:hypothetical protein Bca52824_006607 [Brassica carinata]
MTSVVNKKRVRISSHVSDSDDIVKENPESEKRDTCYVCDGKDDWVLVCHGEDCFISIHQSCTCDEPDFDEFGNFFCPYCWYKRLVLKSSKLREKLSVIDKSGVSENVAEEVNGSQGRSRECDESYEKFMEMEKDQRREEVAAETQSQELPGRVSEKNNHISEDGVEFGLAFNEQEDEDEQIEHPISTDNGQELALVIHNPIEARPCRSVPPENGTAALHEPKQRKRKRVFWTQAEEEMLKIGVQKFPGVRNIPWRKILEFGRDVFHEERAPSDLKDKWKNIIKMSFEAAPRQESGKPPLD